MIKRVGIGLLLCGFFLLGCSGEAVKPKEAETVDLSRFPAWVVNPEMEGYIAAVGYARVQRGGENAQRRVALLAAKAELAKQIEIFVTSELFKEKICTQEACRSNIQSFSKQYASGLMQNIETKEEWFDPKTGDYYIRVATKEGE